MRGELGPTGYLRLPSLTFLRLPCHSGGEADGDVAGHVRRDWPAAPRPRTAGRWPFPGLYGPGCSSHVSGTETEGAEVKRMMDEQYERGMKLLRDNMYLLDELAKQLMEEEKVSGEQLMKLINRAAAAGKLVMGNTKMAVAAYTGEVFETTAEVSMPRKTQCLHPDKPMMFLGTPGAAMSVMCH